MLIIPFTGIRMNWNCTSILVVVLILLLVGVGSWGYGEHYRASQLAAENENLEKEIQGLAVNSSAPDEALATKYGAQVSVLAYSATERTATTIPVHVGFVPGRGTYLNVQDVVHTVSAQQSAQHAHTVLGTTNATPPFDAAVVSINAPEDWDYVSGPSAGLPLAVGMYVASDPSLQLNESIAMTGGITATGEVTTVDEIRPKAIAAREEGKSILLVPPKQDRPVPGIRVIPVTNLTEALDYAVSDAQAVVPNAGLCALDCLLVGYLMIH
jgi:predicted S18 family serine protease